MSGKKITQEDINQIAEWIKEGKTKEEIGFLLAPREIEKEVVIKPQSVIIQNLPIVSMTLEYKIDNNKTISIGASRTIPKRTNIASAHEQLYYELLSSLENIISLNK